MIEKLDEEKEVNLNEKVKTFNLLKNTNYINEEFDTQYEIKPDKFA